MVANSVLLCFCYLYLSSHLIFFLYCYECVYIDSTHLSLFGNFVCTTSHWASFCSHSLSLSFSLFHYNSTIHASQLSGIYYKYYLSPLDFWKFVH